MHLRGNICRTASLCLHDFVSECNDLPPECAESRSLSISSSGVGMSVAYGGWTP